MPLRFVSHILTLKFSADHILKYFSCYSQKTDFDTSSKICMKCQILFSRKIYLRKIS